MFALDIIDKLYYVPMILCVATGLALSNWFLDSYTPSVYLAIVITLMLIALLYHYWTQRLTVKYTLVVAPDEKSIYYTKTSLPKAILHWVYNLFGHSSLLFIILTFFEPYHPLLNAPLFLVWLTTPCLVRTYLKGISLDIIKVTFDDDEPIWSKIQREEFLNKYDCDPEKLQE